MYLLRKIAWALRGIGAVGLRDFSFHLELLGGVFLLFFIWVAWPMSLAELLPIVITYGMVIAAELVNTALETALDRLHPERHVMIGTSKDAAAGAVLVLVVLNVAVVVLVILNRFGAL